MVCRSRSAPGSVPVRFAAAKEVAVESRPEQAIPLPPEEAEIDQLRRRLEDTERAMERIMKQMSTVSQKLNAAKISSNIRALKQRAMDDEPAVDGDREVSPRAVGFGPDSLASESLATDYSLSLDSRGQVLPDPSLYTYSLDTGYTASAPPTRDETGSVATAFSRLARSVSQLSLELETAPGDDDASLPAETGAELSELADGEEAADLLDGVDELRHDGPNATETSLASIEDDLRRASLALKNANTRAAGGSNGKDIPEVPPPRENAPADGAAVQRIQELPQS
ncbi:uncharacterized protein LOC119092449 [Pollicipes pollicipes]|uniref:uncharacterized protein LOC119092449 n=1 Tax=Pollicipes pollicipes TaxID=41117 RepID=UPI0018856F22|nr:uncharacterized protein LOC119092449 [Pollicipes pollicipes]